MTYRVLAALSIAGLLVGACTPQQTAVSQTIGQAVAQGVAPALAPGQLSSTLSALGVSAANQAAISKAVADAQASALRACKILPLAEGVANLAIAAVASGLSPTAQTVQAGLQVLCQKVDAAPTYTSFRGDRLVKAMVPMGNYVVPVYAYKK